MAIVWEMEYEVRNQSLAIITSSYLAVLITQGLLGIKLLAFFQFQVLKQLL